MKSNNLPLKYIFSRLFALGSPYKLQIAFGLIFMSLYASTIVFVMSLIRPLFNIASKSEDGGLNTFNIIKKYSSMIDPYIPISQWGKSFVQSIPNFHNLEGFQMYAFFGILFIGFFTCILTAFFQYFAYYYSHKVSLSALTDVKDQFNGVLINQNMSFHDRYKPGELMSRVQNDTETMSRALIFVYNQAPKGIVVIVAGMIKALSDFPNLMYALLLLPLFILPIKKLGKKIKRYSERTLEKRAELSDVMHQQFGGMQEIKGHNLEESRQEQFKKTNKSLLKGLMGIVIARAKSRAIIEGGGHFAILLILSALIIFMVRNTETQMGDYMQFMAILGILIWTPLRTLSKAYNDFQNSLPGVYNVLEIVDNPDITEECDQPQAFPKSINEIKVNNVSYRYSDGPLVIDNVSFNVTQGQIIAFVGHTGSGKSTMVTFLPRFRDPISGSISINGVDLRNFSLKDLRQNIALVNQDPYLFNTSIRDNLLQGKANATDDELWQALEKAQLLNDVKEMADTMNYQVGERGNNLSGGQKQRLAIARAILKDAPILILDEATSSQDNVTEKNIQAALSTLMQGRTTFVIAHRLSTIHHADQLLIFKDGRIVEEGTHDSLKDADGEYAQLHHSQFIQ